MELALPRLRMLRELTRRGTVTEAAAALHYTASAVSQQLNLLEREVGAPLFERVGRRVRLTELGWVLAGHAEDILAAEERAKVALEEAQGAVAAYLAVGVFATVAAGLIPDVLSRLAPGYPGLRVVTTEVAPEAALAAVRHGDLDLSFVLDYAEAPMPTEANLQLTPVAAEHLYVAAPEGYFAPDAEIELAELGEARWILSGPQSHFGIAVRAACRRAGFEPLVAHQVAEQATAMTMVSAGLGVTLVSDLGLAFQPHGVRILPLREELTRRIMLISRVNALRRPALRVFLDAVHESAAALGYDDASPRSPEPEPEPI